MLHNSIIEVFVIRLSPETELGLILFFFLFPAIWGAILAVAAFFEDLTRILNKTKRVRNSV